MRTPRIPVPPLARTAGLALALALLAGCSSGSSTGGATTATTSPDGAGSPATSSGTTAGDDTATGSTAVESTATAATATSSTTTSSGAQPGPSAATSAPGSATAAAYGYRVTYTPATEKLPGGARGSTTYPKVAVTAGTDPRVRTALENLVRSRIDGARQAFSSDVQELAQPGEDSEQKITVAREARWSWLYAVQLLEYRYVSGAAHPLDNYLTVAVDLRTGRPVRAADLFAKIAPVDTVVRAALQRRQPDADAEAVASVTVGEAPANGSSEVESYPTAAGLWVGVSRCVFACALEPTEVVVPWRELPATRPGTLPR